MVLETDSIWEAHLCFVLTEAPFRDALVSAGLIAALSVSWPWLLASGLGHTVAVVIVLVVRAVDHRFVGIEAGRITRIVHNAGRRLMIAEPPRFRELDAVGGGAEVTEAACASPRNG